MKELTYVKKVGEKVLYDYSPTKGFVELWDFSKSNLNEESRKEAVSLVASISYGNEIAKNPDKLYNLLKEQGHSSPFEFIRFPILNENREDFDYIGIKDSLRNNNFSTYEDFSNELKKLIRADYKIGVEDFISWHRQSIATFKIKVPLFVRSQYHRHRCQSVLEMSRRYVKPNKVEFEFWYPEDSYNCKVGDDQSIGDLISYYIDDSVKLYKQMLNQGYKPEVARSILPQSLYTIFWVMKDYKCARNFYIERYSVYAQEQIRDVAKAELELLKEYQPEFLGQYVKVVGDSVIGLYPNSHIYTVRILDIQEKTGYTKLLEEGYMPEFTKILYCDFGDKDYYAKFSLKEGLFVGKILKEEVGG